MSNEWNSAVWPPNDGVQQRGRLERLQPSESRNTGPGCCNGWFGVPRYSLTRLSVNSLNLLPLVTSNFVGRFSPPGRVLHRQTVSASTTSKMLSTTFLSFTVMSRWTEPLRGFHRRRLWGFNPARDFDFGHDLYGTLRTTASPAESSALSGPRPTRAVREPGSPRQLVRP